LEEFVMSKNKSATRTLAEKPSLENLKKQARTLLNAVHASAAEAEARARKFHPRAGKTPIFERARFSLSDAQLVIAREYGFDSWPKLKAHVTRAPAGVETAIWIDRLYERLQRVARRVEWLSKPKLQQLRSAGDLPGLLAAASAHCDPATKEALLAVHDPKILAERLCAALDSVLRENAPQPLGESSTSAAPPVSTELAGCLVVLHAAGHPHLLGRRYPISEPITRIGRSDASQVPLHSDSVSREHARIERVQHTGEFVFVDQQSTNGSFVNEAPEAVSRHVLEDGDRLAIGDAILCFLGAPDLDAKYRAAVEDISVRDALTRALNQKSWFSETERHILYARGEERALSALVVSIDQFQEVTTRIGSLGGSALLRSFAHLLREELGQRALIGRHADAEFAITLPGANSARATELAEQLIAALSCQPLTVLNDAVNATICVGVATLYRTTGTAELLEDACAALARAQAAGRSSVRGPREAAA
jgi:two-component system, cell cycle response regulator